MDRRAMVGDAGTRPGAAPDILVTNYSMLEYMLMRPFERPLFRQTASWLAEDRAIRTATIIEAALSGAMHQNTSNVIQ